MRIALRTSGGRGEYELAGRQCETKNSDLYDKKIFFELFPGVTINGYTVAKKLQGKPRIRVFDKINGVHSYRIIAAMLLLPKPIRELHKTPDSDIILLSGKYSILGIDVDVVAVTETEAILRPKIIYAGNTSEVVYKIYFPERMALISELWSKSDLAPSPLKNLIESHAEAVTSGNLSHHVVEEVAHAIEEYFGSGGDVLKKALIAVTGTGTVSEVAAVVNPITDDEWKTMEDDDTSSFESVVEQVRKWRQVADRGVSGRSFSEEVKAAYNYRCLFSGSRMPPLLQRKSAGVDSAHILPWAQHQINSVTNGICLNKLCHWAFDSGVVKLDVQDKKYFLIVPDTIKEAASIASFDLEYFLELEGQIDENSLPADKSKWPKPEFIKKLNAAMFPS